MKLQNEPFDNIKSGKKRIEFRLNDKKRQQLRIGDIITFRKLPELTQTITTKIIGLSYFNSFDDCCRSFDNITKTSNLDTLEIQTN